MKSVATFICITAFLCLVLVGCGKKVASVETEDARLTRQIVGAWTMSETFDRPESNGFKAFFKATNCFAADGTCSFVGKVVHSDTNRTFNYESTWLVTNKDLVLTITKTSEPKGQPVGTIIRDHIVQLDAKRMVGEIDGQTNIWERIR